MKWRDFWKSTKLVLLIIVNPCSSTYYVLAMGLSNFHVLLRTTLLFLFPLDRQKSMQKKSSNFPRPHS